MINEPIVNRGIIQLIPIISKQIGAIGKNQENKGQKYWFRGIDDVFFAVNPIFAEHGMVCVPKVLESIREEHTSSSGKALFCTFLTVQFTFYAPDGSSIEVVTVGEGMDSGDKSAYKALSGAMKYAILQLFCIPTEEAKDPETENHDLRSGSQNASRGADDPSLLQQMQRHIADIEALTTIQDLDLYVTQHKASFLASPHRLKISEFCQAKRAELTRPASDIP
jgi:hypothetical protein